MKMDHDRTSQLSEAEIEAVKMNQDIIRRMAENCQKIKTCFLATCALFAAFSGKGGALSGWRVYAAFLVIAAVFWVMDAKYLNLERGFRKHHENIVGRKLCVLDIWRFSPAGNTSTLMQTMFSFSEAIYPAMIIAISLLIA